MKDSHTCNIGQAAPLPVAVGCRQQPAADSGLMYTSPMPRAFAAEATIARPARDVWDALTDWSSAHRWMAGVDRLKADGETARGTRLTFRARDHDRTATITACQPGRSLVLHSEHGGVSADYEYALEELGDSTTWVTLTADCQVRGLLWRILAPLIRIAMKKSDGGQLDALKRLIEDPG